MLRRLVVRYIVGFFLRVKSVISYVDIFRRPDDTRAMTERDRLLQEIDDFRDRHGMAAAPFGAHAVGDRSFVFRLRAGAQPRLDTAEKVRAYMLRVDRKGEKKAG